MDKTKFKYVKYTKQELDRYVRDGKSCIKRHKSEIHVGFPPWGFANFEETLTNIISRDKIGKYDAKLDGIVLDVRNIKVLGTVYPVHDDDPYNHINIQANFYVFQPRIGSIIKGVVKHISHGHVAVIIYRVFNVSIRFNRSEMRDALEINRNISFCIKKFELQGAMPYIEGELMDIDVKAKMPNKHLKFENDGENDAGGDSGISTEESAEPKKAESETDSSDESDSDSDSNSSSDKSFNEKLNFSNVRNICGITTIDLIALIFCFFSHLQIRIKEEKLSDSEEHTKSLLSSHFGEVKREQKNSIDTSDSDESEEGPKSEVNVKQEEQMHSANVSPLLQNIKKEKENKHTMSVSDATFIPRPIKTEPQSDIEGPSKFKTPTSTQSQKTRRSLKASDRSSSPANKRKKLNQSLDITSTFETPIMSSTLKIKEEPASEDESAKRKKSKKTENTKSLKSIESDLFASFLK